jgi:hypothetical protein
VGEPALRIRVEQDDRAVWLGGARQTDANGFFTVTAVVPAGSRLRVWSPRDDTFGHEILVR